MSRIPPEGLEFVALTSCETLEEAETLRACLEAAGIKAFLPDQTPMQTATGNDSTSGLVRVQVAAQQYEAARILLMRSVQVPDAAGDASPSINARQPLSVLLKIAAFMLPVATFPGLIVYLVTRGSFLSQGCDRKATEWWQWFSSGMLFWFVTVIVFLLLKPSHW